jgi:Cu-Zn family superoxide dismutase
MKETNISIILLIFLGACSSKGSHRRAVATFYSEKYSEISGKMKFKETSDILVVTLGIYGLKPTSLHGLHVHEVGKCEGPDYKSAGAHYNPYSHSHGGRGNLQRHIGDFGNLTTDGTGLANHTIKIENWKKGDLEKLRGKAVILHAQRDDLITQPTGDSGARIACGIIK